MNILLTSVGRRSYLVRYFKEALGKNGLVFSANSDPLTTGMLAADRCFTVPRVDSASYIDALLSICKANDIKLVVSLFDIDLPFLARARERFSNIGVNVVVSDPWVVDVVNDKWKTHCFFSRNHIRTPNTYLALEDVLMSLKMGAENFPLILKPRWGMGSLSVFVAEDAEELDFFFRYTKKKINKSYLKILSNNDLSHSVIIQQFIQGEEFGLDVFNDLQGKYFTTVVKKKLAMRSGETDAAVTVENSKLHSVGVKLASLLNHRGNLDVDVLIDHDGTPYVLEMNARFGGGYPFSHIAGANFPKNIIEMAENKTPVLDIISSGVIGLKDINPVVYND